MSVSDLMLRKRSHPEVKTKQNKIATTTKESDMGGLVNNDSVRLTNVQRLGGGRRSWYPTFPRPKMHTILGKVQPVRGSNMTPQCKPGELNSHVILSTRRDEERHFQPRDSKKPKI